MRKRVPNLLPKSFDPIPPVGEDVEYGLSVVNQALQQLQADLCLKGVDLINADLTALIDDVSAELIRSLERVKSQAGTGRSTARRRARLRRELLEAREEAAAWVLQAFSSDRLRRLGPVSHPMLPLIQSHADAMDQTVPASITTGIHPGLLRRQPGDGRLVRARKALRRTKWLLRRLPVRTTNPLRRLLGRPPKEVPAVVRTVPVLALARFYSRGILPLTLEAAAHHVLAAGAIALRGARRMWELAEEGHGGIEALLDAKERLSSEALVTRVAASVERLAKVSDACRKEVDDHGAQSRHAIGDALTGTFESVSRASALAGTSEIPNWLYPAARAARLWMRARRRWDRYQSAWQEANDGIAGGLCLSAELVRIRTRVRKLELGIRQMLRGNATTYLRKPLTEASGECRKTLRQLEAAFEGASEHVGSQDGSAAEEAHRQLEEAENRLATLLTSQIPAKIADGQADDKVARIRTAIEGGSAPIVEDVTEEHHVWGSREPSLLAGKAPPDVPRLTIPARRIVRPRIAQDIPQGLAAAMAGLWAAYTRTTAALAESWKIVRFNLESAIAEVEEPETQDRDAMLRRLQNTRDLACGGVRRGALRLDAAVADIDATLSKAELDLNRCVSKALETVEKELGEVRAVGVRLRIVRQVLAARAGTYGEAAKERAVTLLKSAVGYATRWVGEGRRHAARLLRFVGLVSAQQAETHTTLDEADLALASLDALPPVYRRLFRFAPLQSEDFLVGRTKELDEIRQALERWEAGRPSALAIVGEMGSGKTSLLNCVERSLLKDLRVVRQELAPKCCTEPAIANALSGALGFDPGEDLNEIADRLLNSDGRQVVALENAHELFLRTVGGYEGIRKLLLLMSKTGERVFWVLVMSEYAWRHLERVVRLSDYFPFLIQTRTMSEGEIESAIMARHEVSGYHLRFTVDGVAARAMDRRLRKASSEDGKQALLRRTFFERVADVSRGNVLIALFYWLRAIKRIDGDTMELELMRQPNYDFLSQLSADKLFALAALLQHGTLSAKEFAKVFRLTPTGSQLMLDALRRSNLIQFFPAASNDAVGTEVRFAVNPVMRRPIVSLLQSRHIFY